MHDTINTYFYGENTMKFGKCLTLKLFCVIASIMCVNKVKNAEAQENVLNAADIKTQTEGNIQLAALDWKTCCGFDDSDVIC